MSRYTDERRSSRLPRFIGACGVAVVGWSGVMTAAAGGGGIVETRVLPPPSERAGPLFTELAPTQTGVVTTNDYADPGMWGERYHEFEVGEIGTGVAIGDYDGDGRPDLFVVSKTESCRLFRNLGGFRFEDVTERAGVADHGAAAGIWKQGATFADINNDGRLDLYVCRFNAPNLLYLNQGNGTFTEEAAARGLALVDASGMAAFCDYDRDGWLDVFVHTNLLDNARHPNGQRSHLFRNNRDGTFTEVTGPAGIHGEGQAHSATWWDYDNDGWPDLYVANDFSAADQLYHNNRDGTFTEVLAQVVPHTPFSAMGADLGDVNNDGRIDLLVGDMAATHHVSDQRTMANARSQALEPPPGASGAVALYRNALYLNTGTGRCQEAALLAGIAATDWSWSLRFEDLDNDGRLDLFVTNGIHREVNNADLLRKQMSAESAAVRLRVMRDSPVLAQQHLAYRNLGDLRFADVSEAWGLDQKGVSFGAAFGDLDGDGNLDLVYSNYRAGVTVLRNHGGAGHRVIVALRGTVSNRGGVGATVRIESAAGVQVRSLVLARGYLSSSEPVVHFGLGDDRVIQRLTVDWPSGATQTFTRLPVDRCFTITEPATASPLAVLGATADDRRGQFVDVSEEVGLAAVQREATVDETAQQRLLPFRFNRRGPSLAVGDIDGDGWDDVIVGGTTASGRRVLRAAGPGRFAPREEPALSSPGAVNDGPVLLLDVAGLGRGDLLVTKGGNSLPAGSPEYHAELFLNDGHGGFVAAPSSAMPEFWESVGAVAAADFTHEGRLGVFIGGRLVPGQYPETPASALLVNRGGRFEDVTDELAPGLRRVGLVTSACWSDVDDDGWPDLLLTLDWGEVKCFRNAQGRALEDWTQRLGFATAGTGWWTAIATADFNGDGRPDFVVGNLGLNTEYRAEPTHPALLFYGNFTGEDEAPQLVEAYEEGGRLFPRRSRLDLGAAIPAVLKRYPWNNAYAAATLDQILGPEKRAAARGFAATELRSGVFLSAAGGRYRFEPLPRIVQIAPVQGVVARDLDGDGCADIGVVQNSHAPVPSVGRFDGGIGQWLRGDGRGGFVAVPPAESGIVVPGDAKGLAVVDLDRDGWPDLVVTRNGSTTLALRNRGVPGRHGLTVRLRGAPGNPTAVGARVMLVFSDGSRQTAEVAAGGGFASQSTAACSFGWVSSVPREVEVRWPRGRSTVHAVPAGATEVEVAAP